MLNDHGRCMRLLLGRFDVGSLNRFAEGVDGRLVFFGRWSARPTRELEGTCRTLMKTALGMERYGTRGGRSVEDRDSFWWRTESMENVSAPKGEPRPSTLSEWY